MNNKNSLLIAVIFLFVLLSSITFLFVSEGNKSEKRIKELEYKVMASEIMPFMFKGPPEEIVYEEPEQIVCIVNEYYDGNNLFASTAYTSSEPFNSDELDRINYQWHNSGYDFIDIETYSIDGVDTINLYYEKDTTYVEVYEDHTDEETDYILESSNDEWGEYEWLLHCVAAENGESYDAAWWTASCIVNRAEYEYGSIYAAVSAPGQFSVYSSGSIYTRPVYECAVEAVNAVLSGNRNYEVYFFSAGDLHDREILHVSGSEYFYR